MKIWEEVARDFEAKNPGVKIEMQFLENEAYKAKLPSMLQSKDRPHIIYSWAGGVLKSQIEAGVLPPSIAERKLGEACRHAGVRGRERHQRGHHRRIRFDQVLASPAVRVRQTLEPNLFA